MLDLGFVLVSVFVNNLNWFLFPHFLFGKMLISRKKMAISYNEFISMLIYRKQKDRHLEEISS